MPRIFYLYRIEDESKVSGVGFVAEGCSLSNGRAIVSFLSDKICTEVCENMDTVEGIHGHGGKTIVVWEEDDLIDPKDGKIYLNADTGFVSALEGNKWVGFGLMKELDAFIKPSEYIKILKNREAEAKKGCCEICGKPMPPGEEMFKYHGYSGDCPKD